MIMMVVMVVAMMITDEEEGRKEVDIINHCTLYFHTDIAYYCIDIGDDIRNEDSDTDDLVGDDG